MKTAQYDKENTAEDERRNKGEAESDNRCCERLGKGAATDHGDNCDNETR